MNESSFSRLSIDTKEFFQMKKVFNCSFPQSFHIIFGLQFSRNFGFLFCNALLLTPLLYAPSHGLPTLSVFEHRSSFTPQGSADIALLSSHAQVEHQHSTSPYLNKQKNVKMFTHEKYQTQSSRKKYRT